MIKDDRLKLKEKFLEYFADVPIQKYAGAYIGRSEDTITDWKKADSDFYDRIERAKAEFIQRKLKGIKSDAWVLERLFKDNFAQRAEITGANGDKIMPTNLMELKTNYGELGAEIARSFEREELANDSSVPNKDEARGASDVQAQPNAVETSSGEERP